ncbi:MerR family transcriptional regulator [Anaerobacillus isosaccharinicus]|uniref:MerR family transcriptional regulator n=1 Tax=Anaerobacillus isosaccharinicus TaxID=1532552 RepID=A0A1S2LL28_9BACI|nr:MerR family transcriptional regulator [Anaerobacillus isosaccharinicus]MBA5586127.1 MerR family transcriptional regulator [Anaerobacillus isosaccharinicus]QOY35605.1 MerR family transcriptional regulator [Anaerobacillus isosaccharinicus]
MENKIPPHFSIFPISSVVDMTELTARQIRYYEDQDLIKPLRNKGNQRIFSLNDIERLLEIKSYIDRKINIAGIKEIFLSKIEEKNVIINHDFIYSESELKMRLALLKNNYKR